MKNSVSSAARAEFSHKVLLGKKTSDKLDMLADRGINWEDYPGGCQRGRVVLKVSRPHKTSFKHRGTGETQTTEVVRSFWEVIVPPVFTEETSFLTKIICPKE